MSRFFNSSSKDPLANLPCKACNQKVPQGEDKMFEGRRWHKKCFQCQTCGVGFNGTNGYPVAVKELPYCQDCAVEAKLEKCFICKLPIPDGQAIQPSLLYRKVHSLCFKCDVCATVIGSAACTKRSGYILCVICSSKSNKALGIQDDSEPVPVPATQDTTHKRQRSVDVEFLDDLDGEALDFLDSPNAMPSGEFTDSMKKLEPAVAVSGLKFWKKAPAEANEAPQMAMTLTVGNVATVQKPSFADVAKSPRPGAEEYNPTTPSRVDDFLDEPSVHENPVMTQTLPTNVKSLFGFGSKPAQEVKPQPAQKVAATEAVLSSTMTLSKPAAAGGQPKKWFKQSQPEPEKALPNPAEPKKWFKPLNTKTPTAGAAAPSFVSIPTKTPTAGIATGKTPTAATSLNEKIAKAALAKTPTAATSLNEKIAKKIAAKTPKSEAQETISAIPNVPAQQEPQAPAKQRRQSIVEAEPVAETKPKAANLSKSYGVGLAAELQSTAKTPKAPEANAAKQTKPAETTNKPDRRDTGRHARNKSINLEDAANEVTSQAAAPMPPLQWSKPAPTAQAKPDAGKVSGMLNVKDQMLSPRSNKPSMAQVASKSPRFDAPVPAQRKVASPKKSPQASAAAAPPANIVKFCYECGTKREPLSAKFCFQCGTKY